MIKKQIISIFFTLVLITVSLSSIASIQTDDTDKTMMLARIEYDEHSLSFLKNNQYDILGMKPSEWIDILSVSDELDMLTDEHIDYEIRIEDVDKYCDGVRGTYHTYPEIEQILQSIANDYPSITSLYSIGTSYEGRTIWCLEITDNPGVDEGEPGVFYMGLHHAREWPTVEICLHIADELTSNYGSDPDITNVVDNRRLWLVTCENPDGYVYSHDNGHNMWRKNRRYLPEYGTYGIDANRNYPGSSNGNPWGSWGSIGIGSVDHYPSSDTYCGPAAASENCTQSITNLLLQEDICALISWHTYSELVLWPWGYSVSETTPDNTYLSQVGTEIASRITQQDGTGTYTPQQSAELYPTTGDTTDWAYGYSHYVLGKPCFAYTIEACTTFQPSEQYLDQICEENFDGAMYLLQEAGNISTVASRVVPPVITDMDTDTDGNYQVHWTEQNPWTNTDYFHLDELTGLTLHTDDAESGTALWYLDGFSTSTEQSYSSSHSYHGDDSNGDVSVMTSVYPTPVTLGMNLSFWCWYDIEDNYDMAFVEISTDNRSYDVLEQFTGSSNGWVYKEYTLEDYVDESIFIRFRYTTDTGSLEDGFFVDDIFPLANFSSVTMLSDTITGSYYMISGQGSGDYYYRVKGSNADYGWGDFSTLEKMNVSYGGTSILIDNVTASPIVQETPDWVNLTCNVKTIDAISAIKVNITHPDGSYTNQSMSRIVNTSVYYLNMTCSLYGVYNFSIWVDTSTSQKRSDIYHFYIGHGYKILNMSIDWNLITMPVDNGWYASDLACNITGCLSVSKWDQYAQSYWAYFVGGPDSFDYQLEPGYGYFVETETASVFACNGTNISSVSIPMKIAWNLIGWYHENDTTAKSLSENITGCLSVSKWDPSTQSYWAYFVGGPDSFDFTISQGMGLFVEVDQESTWQGEG